MFDILSSIHYDESLHLQRKTPMAEPYTAEERKIAQLLALFEQHTDWRTAEALLHSITMLACEERSKSFHSGVRFGAQLMLQLTEDF